MMKKINQIFGAVNLLLVAAVFIGNYFYLGPIGGLTLKALCSSGFALMGLVNLAFAVLTKQKNLRFYMFLSAGLILACLGDIVIGSDFILGAGLFAMGHVFYLIAGFCRKPLAVPDMIIFAILFVGAGSFVLFCPLLEFPEPIMKWVCFIYAAIISAMVGKLVGNCIREKNEVHLVLAVGAILFFFSDLMLVFNWFMDMGRITSLLCMATYYPAQCLLAGSAYLAARRNNTSF